MQPPSRPTRAPAAAFGDRGLYQAINRGCCWVMQ
jgi:hypothetical protein